MGGVRSDSSDQLQQHHRTKGDKCPKILKRRWNTKPAQSLAVPYSVRLGQLITTFQPRTRAQSLRSWYSRRILIGEWIVDGWEAFNGWSKSRISAECGESNGQSLAEPGASPQHYVKDGVSSEDLLQEIDARLRDDMGASAMLRNEVLDEAAANDILAAIDAWMSLASYAIGRTYAPQGPFRGGLAGWTLDVGRRIEDLASSVRGALSRAAKGLELILGQCLLAFPLAYQSD